MPITARCTCSASASCTWHSYLDSSSPQLRSAAPRKSRLQPPMPSSPLRLSPPVSARLGLDHELRDALLLHRQHLRLVIPDLQPVARARPSTQLARDVPADRVHLLGVEVRQRQALAKLVQRIQAAHAE